MGKLKEAMRPVAWVLNADLPGMATERLLDEADAATRLGAGAREGGPLDRLALGRLYAIGREIARRRRDARGGGNCVQRGR